MKVTAFTNWKNYFIEAWALGMFMISASVFVALFEHPAFFAKTAIPSVPLRRAFIGAAMGITAILLIYSKWGKQSGAHMNPAVTLANYFLNRISLKDTMGYVLFQVVGACMAMLLLKYIFPGFLSDRSVNYIVTMPGKAGVAIATIAEFVMSFIMFLTVMIVSNSRFNKYTGYFAGALVFVFITVEAPLSGMSINPARSIGSAVAAGSWGSFWLYIISPVAGMLFSAFLFQSWYFYKKGECRTMNCFMNGRQFNNKAYHVYSWFQKNEKGETVSVFSPKKEEEPTKVVTIQY